MEKPLTLYADQESVNASLHNTLNTIKFYVNTLHLIMAEK
jgi:hypothetical protein